MAEIEAVRLLNSAITQINMFTLRNNVYTQIKIYKDRIEGDVLVNFSYLFIIKVIMDQVIGAIIVDKFAQIRQ
jgi:hypothetical protein